MQLASSGARSYQSIPRATWALEQQVLLHPVSERNQQLLTPVNPPPEYSPAPLPYLFPWRGFKKKVLNIHPLHCGLAWGFDGDGFSLMILRVQFLVCFPLILSVCLCVQRQSSKLSIQEGPPRKEISKEIVTFHELNKSTKVRAEVFKKLFLLRHVFFWFVYFVLFWVLFHFFCFGCDAGVQTQGLAHHRF